MQTIMRYVQYVWDDVCFHLDHWMTRWDFINIMLPVILPFAGMVFMMWLKTADARHARNAKFIVTVKDGQLGYIAVVMSLTMISELAGKTLTNAAMLACLAGVLASIWGTVSAAGGAVYTTELGTSGLSLRGKVGHYRIMWSSVGALVLAALVFHHTHHYLVESQSAVANKSGEHHG